MILAADDPNCRNITAHRVSRIANAEGFAAFEPGVSAAVNECENRALASMTAASHKEEAVCH